MLTTAPDSANSALSSVNAPSAVTFSTAPLPATAVCRPRSTVPVATMPAVVPAPTLISPVWFCRCSAMLPRSSVPPLPAKLIDTAFSVRSPALSLTVPPLSIVIKSSVPGSTLAGTKLVPCSTCQLASTAASLVLLLPSHL